ncbi:hypothetical protein GOV04_00270 [Candidatus Woesearchaeota archaeon]|nr:hypothetical protein [Candidatus Woesearchaeota archaeon]
MKNLINIVKKDYKTLLEVGVYDLLALSTPFIVALFWSGILQVNQELIISLVTRHIFFFIIFLALFIVYILTLLLPYSLFKLFSTQVLLKKQGSVKDYSKFYWLNTGIALIVSFWALLITAILFLIIKVQFRQHTALILFSLLAFYSYIYLNKAQQSNLLKKQSIKKTLFESCKISKDFMLQLKVLTTLVTGLITFFALYYLLVFIAKPLLVKSIILQYALFTIIGGTLFLFTSILAKLLMRHDQKT